MAEPQYIPNLNGNDIPGLHPLLGLVRDIIAGNRTAQKLFYNKYSPFVYGIIRRYITVEATAQEILNDSFYKILTRMDSYTFKGSIEGWMRTITVNTITDHARKQIRHDKHFNPNVTEADAAVDHDIAGNLSYKALLVMVHELPDTQRMVFNLYVFEDLPHKEIARLLDITESNSRWQLNDARRRLKVKIKSTM